jgi:hypothetical protein
LIHQAVGMLDKAATRLQRAMSVAQSEGRPLTTIETMLWDNAMNQVERLIGNYLCRQQQKNQERDQRRRNKLQRLARRKARARA